MTVQQLAAFRARFHCYPGEPLPQKILKSLEAAVDRSSCTRPPDLDLGCGEPHPVEPMFLCERPLGHGGDHAVGTWPGMERVRQVAQFAALMERELKANWYKDAHPLSLDFDHLIEQLLDHVEKFATAPTEEHAADVANLAMLALAAAPSLASETG